MSAPQQPLSERQAKACENAKHPRCRCRCGGTFHGKARAGADVPPREWFEQLPESDPHHLPREKQPDLIDALRAAVEADQAIEKASRALSHEDGGSDSLPATAEVGETPTARSITRRRS